jgi:hypothetical protein
MADMEQIKHLIYLGIGIEEAIRYGGGVNDKERSELEDYEFRQKIDKETEYEKYLDRLIDNQIDKGNSKALIWAMEKKIGRYAGSGSESGTISIHVHSGNAGDIVEEG